MDYAESVAEDLGDFRVEVEDRDWTVGRKIRQGHEDNVPYMLIVGDDEEADGTVSVRDRKEREADDIERAEFREYVERERDQQHTEPTFLSGR
jgi:threonyl-tRNA synthetase